MHTHRFISIKIKIKPKTIQAKGNSNNLPNETKIVETEVIPNPTKEKIIIKLINGTSLYLLFFTITKSNKNQIKSLVCELRLS